MQNAIERVSAHAGSNGGAIRCMDRTHAVWVCLPNAPVVHDFIGKPWEARYPDVLVEYYRACRGIREPGARCSYDKFDSGSFGDVDVRTGVSDDATCVEEDGKGSTTCEGQSGDKSAFVGSFCDTVDGGIDGAGHFDGRGHVHAATDATVIKSGKKTGPNGGVSIGRGVNYERNQLRRQRMRLVRADADVAVSGRSFGERVASSVSKEINDELARTWAERKIRENKLSVIESDRRLADSEIRAQQLRAQAELKLRTTEQQLVLQAAQDVEQLKKRQAVRVVRDTEVSRVAIERAYGTLVATGNASPVGSVSTIVSGGSGSISPNSSISLAELHALQVRNQEYEEENRRQADIIAAVKKMGISIPEHLERKVLETCYTADSNGCLPDYIHEIDPNPGMLAKREDGKFYRVPDPMNYW